MPTWIEAAPGRLYVIATLLPLLGFALLLLVGGVRSVCRPFRQNGGTGSSLYWLCGGDRPLKTGAYFVTVLMAVAAVLAVLGLVLFLSDQANPDLTTQIRAARWAERIDWIRIGALDSSPPEEWAHRHRTDPTRPVPSTALALELGYRIDHLTALMFAMVTVIGTLIFAFSIGYMADETKETVEDHFISDKYGGVGRAGDDHHHDSFTHTPIHVRTHSSFSRRGRFGRFFLYLSLFCFSMLNLLIADNLFQVFVSWELVGLCSFFLIGFYYERPSAAVAANKAFIVNRIGDAGFLVGIFIAWSSFGTLNFEEMKHRLRGEHHANLTLANPTGANRVSPPEDSYLPSANGSHLLLAPMLQKPTDDDNPIPATGTEPVYVPKHADYFSDGVMPYWVFVAMGIGLFLGCVGKSAQIPLHTWLPDAMEGPTPVSALIHAATMVAAGVYLVGRSFPLFAPEVLLLVAYVGAITLFVSATIAMVQTDIKRVLAYSTCSQLGYMMLALGVGGWVAGLLHLLTHAFFKALLFLGSGSVIHGCHHEQDLRKMGGLYPKMKITALTMLVGVLAIAGTPFFSGWYSKDLIIQSALGFGLEHPKHMALFVLPLLTAAMTGFYMFRLWFLAFTGKPRDEHLAEHAHESPPVMWVPLVVLAVFSIGVAWGWPLWDAGASYLGKLLHAAEPPAVESGFAHAIHKGHENHVLAGLLALVAATCGAGLAVAMYWKPLINPAALRAKLGGVYTFFLRKWYFDEAYNAAFVQPTVALAYASAAADKRPTDGPRGQPEPKGIDLLTLDGWLNAVGQITGTAGRSLRAAQTGRLRSYVLVLALTATALLAMLAVLK